jgi:hypothetical protein
MKFKIGDKVRIVAGKKRLDNIGVFAKVSGLAGKITNIHRGVDRLPCKVYFVKLKDFWYFDSRDLELVEQSQTNTDNGTIRQFETGTTKPTNPKDALAINKAPLSTLPTAPMYEVALAMLEGARKYGRHNYRIMGVKASVYYDAAMGHITSFWEGEDIDPASGIHHLGKAMACLAVLRDSMMMENWVDDRPPRYPKANELMRNNPTVKTILSKYPDCVEPFTEVNKDIVRNA